MGQARQHTKDLSERVRKGDRDAATQLLSHSVRLGHRRLAVRRLFFAHAIGAKIDADDVAYCAKLLDDLPFEAIRDLAGDAQAQARRIQGRASLA